MCTINCYKDGRSKRPFLLVPSLGGSCANGFSWSESDPVQQGWLVSNCRLVTIGAVLQFGYNDKREQQKCAVYFTQCTGPCACRKTYDGQVDGYLNVNNKYAVDYELLMLQLHLFLEGRSPLATTHRAISLNHSHLSGSCVVPYYVLRRAWDTFLRLLDIDWQGLFFCPICKSEPKRIVCDGTALGFRQDLLRARSEPAATQQRVGTTHADRVFIYKPAARKLLLQYSGVHPQQKRRRPGTPPVPLGKDEFFQLCALLLMEVNGLPVRQLLLDSHGPESTEFLCPSYIQEFVEGISRNGPITGFVQVVDGEVIPLLEDITKGLPIRSTEFAHKFRLVQENCPAVSQLLASMPGNSLDLNVAAVVKQVLDFMKKSIPVVPCSVPFPPATEEPDIPGQQGTTAFFPNLPRHHGASTYGIDKQRSPRSCSAHVDSCNKHYSGHPTLTPGVFTLYCPHGICYGFEVSHTVFGLDFTTPILTIDGLRF
ncbi:uncharacterized protein LOC135823439 isoform X2 [Sycon ciliatum]|uniref:uncharacterized protein LOC135823439 isoform X2 n=1 Tax=Sycon ciliatum TaxID=27933 RepID=UPI0031F68004